MTKPNATYPSSPTCRECGEKMNPAGETEIKGRRMLIWDCRCGTFHEGFGDGIKRTNREIPDREAAGTLRQSMKSRKKKGA